MTARSLARRTVALTSLAAWLGASLACSQVDPEPKPASGKPAAKKAPAKPKAEGLRASPSRLGPLTSATPPTVEGVDAAMTDKYTVKAAGEGAIKGSTVQVYLGDKPILDILPSADGTYLAQAFSTDPHVIFPFESKVGDRIGSHPNWSRMTCTKGEAPFDAFAVCAAFAEARIAYLVTGWEGDAATIPGKELLADLKVAGVLWAPDAPGAEKKDEGKGDGKKKEAAKEQGEGDEE